MTKPAPCSTLKDRGRAKVAQGADAARSAKPPTANVSAITRSPAEKPEPGAASSTVPATSVPGMNGGSGLTW
jgi:hypothetical protein